MRAAIDDLSRRARQTRLLIDTASSSDARDSLRGQVREDERQALELEKAWRPKIAPNTVTSRHHHKRRPPPRARSEGRSTDYSVPGMTAAISGVQNPFQALV